MFRHIFREHGIKLFDVTMRNWLKSVKGVIPLETKKNMTVDMLKRRRPDSMEIGALVSPNVMPQMSTSIELFKYANQCISNIKELDTKLFMLVPPRFDKLCQAHELGVRHVSIMSSASDHFQMKNVRHSTTQTLTAVTNSLRLLRFDSVKVYLSCVDQCPVLGGGRLHAYQIADSVLDYLTIPQVSEICLSDTIGTLTAIKLAEILEEVAAAGVSMNKISLHLHVKKDNVRNTTAMMYVASIAGIKKLDVSDTTIGGCNMTMDASQMHGNLTYDVLRDSIEKYTIMRMDCFESYLKN